MSADLAAIVAEAQRLLDATVHPPCGGAGCVDVHGRPACTGHVEGASETLLTYARQVIALAARLTAAEASAAAAVARADAAIAAHAALAAAVRTEREAVAEYEAAWAAHIADGTPISAAEGVMAMSDRVDTARAALDALLRGAPAGYVRADVVAEYLAAESARNVSTVEAQSRRVAARTALDAALAAAGGGR